MRSSAVFSHLIDEYGSHESVEGQITRKNSRKPTVHPNAVDQPGTMKRGSALIQSEERVTGSVPWATYTTYFRFAGSILWVPAIITLVLLSQAASGELTWMVLRGLATHLDFSWQQSLLRLLDK